MGGCGVMGLFPNIFEGSLKSSFNSWESQPCSAGAPLHLCTAGKAPQAQLKNHLCTFSAPGTAEKTTQGTAGWVISAQLALVGLPQEHIQSQEPGVGLLRAVAELAMFHCGGLVGISPFAHGRDTAGLISMWGPGVQSCAEGCNCLSCAQNISCASQIFTQGKTKS